MLNGAAIDTVGRILLASLLSSNESVTIFLMPLANEEFEEREVNKCRTKWV